MKNKGFVVSAVLYPLLVIFLALIMGLLAMSTTRKRILDTMKTEIADSIFDSSTCDCEVINNTLKEYEEELKRLEKEGADLVVEVSQIKKSAGVNK